MLLYNQRKEFVGIDEDDLNSLDFQNINELQNESHDFADLFVKKPGYIHNFKNFSWIDFILHSETNESKAIIHAKGKNYSCTIHITPFHFSSDENGYAVIIRNLRTLRGSEDAQASKDLEAAGGVQSTPAPSTPAPVAKPAPVPETPAPELDISLDDIKMDQAEETPSFSTPEPEPELPSFESSTHQELSEPDPLDVPEPQDIDLNLGSPEEILATENEFGAPIENDFGAPSDIDYNAPLDIGMDLMSDDVEEPSFTEEAQELTIPQPEEPVKEEAPMLGDYVSGEGHEHLSDLVASGEYQYDPNVAAGELGLPVDLIEEFIGDFIDQAHEFKDDLYASVEGEDYDNVQVLSHKLKGVAANLRVEDAFDVLSVVNTSKDKVEVLPNLNQFYKIIAKLEGKEIPEPAPAAAPVTETVVPEPELAPEEEYDLEIKQPDDGPILVDEEVHTQANDDLYDDLLAPKSFESEETAQASAPIEGTESLDDDLYDDLLAQPSFEEETPVTVEESAPIEEAPSEDLYDDLLAQPDFKEDTPATIEPTANLVESSLEDEIPEDLLATAMDEPVKEAANTSIEVPPLNFDPQSSANQLGIPVDIVNEFIQDFKEQVNSHQIDFQHAVETDNIAEVNATATLLKGMSDNLRLNEISEVLKELQSETNINNTADAIAKVQAYADQL